MKATPIAMWDVQRSMVDHSLSHAEAWLQDLLRYWDDLPEWQRKAVISEALTAIRYALKDNNIGDAP